MRDYRRIDPMLARIKALWHHNPDLRLTQLITNVLGHGGDHFYVEDDVLDARLREMLRNLDVQLELPIEEETAS